MALNAAPPSQSRRMMRLLEGSRGSDQAVYPGKAHQFLEAVLNNPEKSRGLARKSKAVGDLNARRSNGRRPAMEPALAADWPSCSCAPPSSE
jgi:hypothetical protein